MVHPSANEHLRERERERERERARARESERAGGGGERERRESTGSRRGRCDEEGDGEDRTPAARPGAQRRDSSRSPCVCTCLCGSNPPSFGV
jgi:hypothetical protein